MPAESSKEVLDLYCLAGTTAGGTASQMFGKPCYKVAGKAFVCLFGNEMVFKLPPEVRAHAMSFEGATLFDPSGKGRAMKEWVQLPYSYKDQWMALAADAARYVTTVAS